MKTVGMDIGGTQVRAAVFDENGLLLDKYIIPNDKNIGAAGNMDKLIDFVMSKGYEYRGIGIGCPGPINIRLGKIINPPNLVGWDNFEIARYVEEKTNIKTVLNNDANVAGLAEAMLGAGKGYESVFFFTVSTGVGGAYIYQGKLVNGANSTAAEIYNLIVNEDSYSHRGVNPGSLNEQCSGSALGRIASEKYGREVDGAELFRLFYEHDKTAVEIIERAVDNFAKGIGNVACTVDPDIFIVGGSVCTHNPQFVEMIRERAKKYVIYPQFLRIADAKFSDEAGLVGASLLV